MRNAGSFLEPESEHDSAHTDLLSNHTVFKNQEHYHALLRSEDLPVETYSSFMHEATHHWCFSSPVMTALSLLYMSVARKAFRWTFTGDESERNDALDDLCVYKIALRLLRPLNEGLAQFAEYDVLPSGKGDIASPPLLSSLDHLFNLPRRLGEGRKDDYDRSVIYQLSDDITRWRLSRRTVERKCELLLQPAGMNEGSEYLLGYLTVKQLWKTSARFYEPLKEADTFLLFLRKLILGDFSLVSVLLDRSLPALQRGATFGIELHRRLHNIRLMKLSEGTPWSNWLGILQPKATERPPLYGSYIGDVLWFGEDTEAQARQGLALHMKLVHEAAEPMDFRSAPTPPPGLLDPFYHLLRERYLMWLGTVPATWVPSGRQTGQVWIGEKVLYPKFKLPGAPPGLKDIKVNVYIDIYQGNRFTTVGIDQQNYAVAVAKKLKEPGRTEMTQARLNREASRADTVMIHNAISTYTGGTNFQEILENFWKTGGSKMVDQTYRNFAFNFLNKANAHFSKVGLAGILQNDPDLIRSVAAISLASSAGLSIEGLETFCPDLPLKPLKAIERVKKLWNVADLPLADIGEDGFLASAF